MICVPGRRYGSGCRSLPGHPGSQGELNEGNVRKRRGRAPVGSGPVLQPGDLLAEVTLLLGVDGLSGCGLVGDRRGGSGLGLSSTRR
jgi:hypothetical protein